jgi:PEGA domain
MRTILALLIVLFTTGCATIVRGPSQTIPVTTDPPGASVAVDCGKAKRDQGVTPTQVRVPRKPDLCSITLTKAGYAPLTVKLHREREPIFWLNITPGLTLGIVATAIVALTGEGNADLAFVGAFALGSGPGMLIDWATGAIFRHEPGKLDERLEPAP